MQTFKFEDLFLSKEFIEECGVSEEDIFAYYLYPVNFNKKFLNPFRSDTYASANYYVSKSGNLYFCDWSPRAIKKYYSCYDACSAFYGNISYHESLKKVYQDLVENKNEGIIHNNYKSVLKPKRIPTNGVKLAVSIKDFSEEELSFWNIGGITDITQSELQENGIYSIKTLFENDWSYSNLKNTYAFVEDGVINQIYFPKNKYTNKRRFINRPNFHFSTLNLAQDDKKIFIISKSDKDRFYLNKFGVSSQYCVNETQLLNRKIFTGIEKQYDYVGILGDNDRQGRIFALKHRKEYGTVVFFTPVGNDFSEYLSIVGWKEVSETIEYYKNKL